MSGSGNYIKQSGKHQITVDILKDLIDDEGKLKQEYLPNITYDEYTGTLTIQLAIEKLKEDLKKHTNDKTPHIEALDKLLMANDFEFISDEDGEVIYYEET